MAIKYKGSGKFTYNLDVQAQKPFDSRLVVTSYENDLAGEKYKSTFVLGGANAWYDGMLVYAEDTKKVYVLKGDEGFVEVGQDLSDAELTDTTYSFESAKNNGTDVKTGAYFKVTEKGQDTPQTIYVNADLAGTAAAVKNEIIGGATTAGDTLGKLEASIAAVASKGYKVIEVTDGLEANIERRYQLADESGAPIQGSVNIDIQKDSSLKNVELVDRQDEEGVATGNYLKFTYLLADGKQKVQYLDVSKLLSESEFQDGLSVSTSGVVTVKVDSSSEFLSVSEAGVKVSGVSDAIDSKVGNAIKALNSNGGSATVESGKHVAVQVTQSEGKITAVSVAESDIASAQALNTLNTTVSEYTEATDAALQEINDRIDGIADDYITSVEVTSAQNSFLIVAPDDVYEKGESKFTLSTTLASSGNPDVSIKATGLATDKYVKETFSWASF